MQIKTEDIIIYGMSFSPVDVKQDLEDIKQGSTLTTDIDTVVLELFKKYIVYIWNKNTEKFYAADFIDSESRTYDIEKDLNASLDFDLAKKDEFEAFNKISKKLAYQLVSFMKGTTNPKAGILFILNTKIGDFNYLCILKVDVAKEEIHIWFDEEDLKITYDRVENVLPDPKKLQKGAIYPHPSLDKDLKILQETYKATFFDQFLQCKRELTEYKQFKEIPKIVSAVNEELSPDVEINAEQVTTDSFTELKSDESFTTQKLVDLAKKAAPEAKEEVVRESVQQELKKRGIRNIDVGRGAIKKYKEEIRIDDITIKGPMKSIEDKVTIEEKNGAYCVMIKGNTKPRVEIKLK